MKTLKWSLCLGICLVLFSFKGEKDKLHKRIFIVTQTEYKDGKPKNKTIEDEIEFKDGKVFSNLAFDKLEYKWIKYDLKKDSTYMDEDLEKEYIEVLATSENDKGEKLEMTMIVDYYAIEGVMKLTKAGKLKRHFEFTGKEKPKKSKK